MIELFLNQALVDLVRTSVKDFVLSGVKRKTETSQGRRAGALFVDKSPEITPEIVTDSGITVYNGWLPEKSAANPSDYPFVTVRPTAATVLNGGTQVTEEILVGTFSRDNLGYQDVLNVTHRIMMQIAELQNNVLANKYERMGAMQWSMPFEQEKPFFMAVITTTWNIYTTEFHFDI